MKPIAFPRVGAEPPGGPATLTKSGVNLLDAVFTGEDLATVTGVLDGLRTDQVAQIVGSAITAALPGAEVQPWLAPRPSLPGPTHPSSRTHLDPTPSS